MSANPQASGQDSDPHGESWSGEGLIGLTVATLAVAMMILYLISP